MTYEIRETLPEPIVKGLTLQIGGEIIAKAWPLLSGNHWRMSLGDDNLHVDLGSVVHARRVLTWIGEQIVSSPAIIRSEKGLHLAKPGVIYLTSYNGGNQYRVDADRQWYYGTPHMIACGTEFAKCPMGTPFRDAYPLVEMR